MVRRPTGDVATKRQSKRANRRESAQAGLLWMAWCGVMFFTVLAGGSALWERAVVRPDCARSCEAAGEQFDHLRVGSRSGPTTACICTNDHAIETGLPDLGVLVSGVVFLCACWVPFVFLMRARRAAASAPPE